MLIELKNITVALGGKTILHEINLEFEVGKFTLIQGHSGSGISVLLKTAAGLIQPCSGQVLYDGMDIAGLKGQNKRQAHTRTGFMFQDAALWANMNLASNLDLPLQAKFPHMDGEVRKQKIDEALKQLRFAVDLNIRPVELSLGQQKVLAFLRATIPGPEALILDEPLAGMDSYWIDIVLKKMIEFRDSGTTLIFGSHNLQIPSGLVDHLVVLHKGRIRKSEKEVPL